MELAKVRNTKLFIKVRGRWKKRKANKSLHVTASYSGRHSDNIHKYTGTE
jgi:hypothetical protein